MGFPKLRYICRLAESVTKPNTRSIRILSELDVVGHNVISLLIGLNRFYKIASLIMKTYN